MLFRSCRTGDLSTTAALVMAGGTGQRLRPLTDRRPKPLLPFAGVFRILDFTLSNCNHSGIRYAGMLSQYESRQIGEHLRRVWDPQGRGSFEHLPPANGRFYAGTADAVRQNLDVLLERQAEDILILSADHLYQADYRKLVAFHRKTGADVTVAASRVPLADAPHFGVLSTGTDHRVTAFEEKPVWPEHIPGDPSVWASTFSEPKRWWIVSVAPRTMVSESILMRNVHVGAGTITCNYDGAQKHRTIIEDDALIGSDSQLVAPVTVGKGATLGAGTTLTQDAPAHELTISRARQVSIKDYKRPHKKEH